MVISERLLLKIFSSGKAHLCDCTMYLTGGEEVLILPADLPTPFSFSEDWNNNSMNVLLSTVSPTNSPF